MNRVSSLNLFGPLCVAASMMVLLFILVPLAEMILQPSMADLVETVRDEEVMSAIGRSLSCSGAAAIISCIFGTPIAYLLARSQFRGKKIIESIIDLPIMIPHPVVGIALLSLAGRNHPFGRFLHELGFTLLGTTSGIITVLTFVALPFYINTAKAGFQTVPKRIEQVARSLGAGQGFGLFGRSRFPVDDDAVGAQRVHDKIAAQQGKAVPVKFGPRDGHPDPVIIGNLDLFDCGL